MSSAARLTRVVLRVFVIGCFLVGLATTAKHIWPGHDFFAAESGRSFGARLVLFGLEISREVGIAFLVASVVAYSFERLLARARLREFYSFLELPRRMEEFGFKDIYESRQTVFKELLERSLLKAHRQLRIMGICVSLFKEAHATGVRGRRASILTKRIVALMRSGCIVHVLVLKRFLTGRDRQYLRLPESADLYYMRERDEDSELSFTGSRLKKIANDSVGNWISVLVEATKETITASDAERRSILSRLEVREYASLPYLSVYIIDDEVYVTPYLNQRHCRDVPSFKVIRVPDRERSLYQEYCAHFEAAWNDERTESAIPEAFVDLLVSRPAETVSVYEENLERVSRQTSEMEEADPERFRVAELSVEETVRMLLGGSDETGRDIVH